VAIAQVALSHRLTLADPQRHRARTGYDYFLPFKLENFNFRLSENVSNL
jgi:hypothetical protein